MAIENDPPNFRECYQGFKFEVLLMMMFCGALNEGGRYDRFRWEKGVARLIEDEILMGLTAREKSKCSGVKLYVRFSSRDFFGQRHHSELISNTVMG